MNLRDSQLVNTSFAGFSQQDAKSIVGSHALFRVVEMISGLYMIYIIKKKSLKM
jgi:hypothetical protein